MPECSKGSPSIFPLVLGRIIENVVAQLFNEFPMRG
jgi:hypothetical protein